jgi:hypothetical protein
MRHRDTVVQQRAIHAIVPCWNVLRKVVNLGLLA